MQFRVTAHVHLIQDRVIPGHALVVPRARPVKCRIHDRALWNARRAVAFIERQVVIRFHLVTEDGWIPFQFSDVCTGIRIQQELIRVEAMACFRLVRTMHAETVRGAWPDCGQVAVPYLVRILGERDTLQFLFAGVVENADLDLACACGEYSEIRSSAVPRRATWMRSPLFDAIFPDLNHGVWPHRKPVEPDESSQIDDSGQYRWR